MTRKLDDPAVTPYRAPVHQIAFAVRDGRALLGIAHAGELLAAMRLSAADVRALVERMTDALPALDAAPPPKPKKPAWTPPPDVRIVCADCGEGFTALGYGRRRHRCPACQAKRNRMLDSASELRRQKARKREAVGG